MYRSGFPPGRFPVIHDNPGSQPVGQVHVFLRCSLSPVFPDTRGQTDGDPDIEGFPFRFGGFSHGYSSSGFGMVIPGAGFSRVPKPLDGGRFEGRGQRLHPHQIVREIRRIWRTG